jgi:hypothetical protein
MVRRGRAAKFIPADMTGNVFREGSELPIAPIFVEDVELQCVTLDFEIVQCRHGVGVVASPAHHSAELITNLANDEVLFGSTYAKAEPNSHNVFLGQR